MCIRDRFTIADCFAFVLSELRAAFSIGILFLIPFFVIDILVACILAVLDVRNLKVMVVSVPLKLLFFVSIDGWTLVAEKLLKGYV